MRFAVVQLGGKQYIAQEGETIEVDRLPLEVGRTVEVKEVLLAVDDGLVQVGSPLVEGASIQASVEAQIKGPKVRVFKYIPKERYRRRRGHRQQYTRLVVQSIALPGVKTARPEVETPSRAEGKPKAAARKVEAKPRPAARPAKKPAAKPAAKAATAKKPAAKKK